MMTTIWASFKTLRNSLRLEFLPVLVSPSPTVNPSHTWNDNCIGTGGVRVTSHALNWLDDTDRITPTF